MTLDWTVIAFALPMSLVTAVIFGILPALQISRLDVCPGLYRSRRRRLRPWEAHRVQFREDSWLTVAE